MKKVINEDTKSKHLALKVKRKENNESAVVLLDRIPFNPADSLETLTKGFESVDQNDIYYRFIAPQRSTRCKMIFPATEAHLKKYSQQSRRIIKETPEMHQRITSTLQNVGESGQIEWIENILADQSEMERRLVDKSAPKLDFNSSRLQMDR